MRASLSDESPTSSGLAVITDPAPSSDSAPSAQKSDAPTIPTTCDHPGRFLISGPPLDARMIGGGPPPVKKSALGLPGLREGTQSHLKGRLIDGGPRRIACFQGVASRHISCECRSSDRC